jgi:hypothetical protein
MCNYKFPNVIFYILFRFKAYSLISIFILDLNKCLNNIQSKLNFLLEIYFAPLQDSQI